MKKKAKDKQPTDGLEASWILHFLKMVQHCHLIMEMDVLGLQIVAAYSNKSIQKPVSLLQDNVINTSCLKEVQHNL